MSPIHMDGSVGNDLPEFSQEKRDLVQAKECLRT